MGDEAFLGLPVWFVALVSAGGLLLWSRSAQARKSATVVAVSSSGQPYQEGTFWYVPIVYTFSDKTVLPDRFKVQQSDVASQAATAAVVDGIRLGFMGETRAQVEASQVAATKSGAL